MAVIVETQIAKEDRNWIKITNIIATSRKCVIELIKICRLLFGMFFCNDFDSVFVDVFVARPALWLWSRVSKDAPHYII